MNTPVITTHRLILQPLQPADAEQIQRIFPRWEIVRYLAAQVPWPYPDDGASHYVNHVALPAVERGEAWLWTLRRQADPDQVIGLIMLQDVEDCHRGFWLVPEWQGQGLMGEASNAVTDFWFDSLDRTVLRAPKAVMNDASRRLSQRSGMRLIKTGRKAYVCGECDSEVWEVTREEWHQRRKER